MKIDGSWEHDNNVLFGLNLENRFTDKSKEYGGNKKKAMTAVMIEYLESRFPDEKEELKLIMQKAHKFLAK